MAATARRSRASLAKKNWSFLAYIAGDNNLSDAGLEDIREMCEVGASPRVHAAVQIDTEGAFEGVVRYEVSEPDATGVSHRTVIERLAELDSGDPGTLRDSLQWGFDRYPARRRVVVVWNHGSGFRTARGGRRDIAYDDAGGSLDMNEMDGVLCDVGANEQHRISILGFDACLMNMVEIANHLRKRAEFIVGSEQTEPGDGWPYDQVLKILNQNLSARKTAGRMVSAYIKSYKDIGEQNVTQSAVDTSKTEEVMKRLSTLGNGLAARMPQLSGAMRQVRTAVQSYEYADYADLVHLCELVQGTVPPGPDRAAAADVAIASKLAVVASGSYGTAVRNSHGLSVWFPSDRSTYLNFRSKYIAMDFYNRHQGWVNFLDRFHSL